ncbi:MAG: TIGR00730 family Rossman fold protein [Bacteroidales bacterium]|jgi:hypothetical protein|nr:TIGR00730 family Rossman fold protein [Bacteroidales bacterium]
MPEKKAVVFCSASFDIDERYNDLARDVVRILYGCGYGMVSGGTVKGTMNVIAEEARRLGMEHKGVLPIFMKGLEYRGLTELVWTPTMSERKEAMRAGTCLAVALPGGIGTLDEVIETLTLAKLNRYPGKVVAFNFEGFYEPLKALLDHYVGTGMLDKPSRRLISFPETLEEFLAIVQ